MLVLLLDWLSKGLSKSFSQKTTLKLDRFGQNNSFRTLEIDQRHVSTSEKFIREWTTKTNKQTKKNLGKNSDLLFLSSLSNIFCLTFWCTKSLFTVFPSQKESLGGEVSTCVLATIAMQLITEVCFLAKPKIDKGTLKNYLNVDYLCKFWLDSIDCPFSQIFKSHQGHQQDSRIWDSHSYPTIATFSAIHKQNCLCWNFGIQVGGYKTPVEPKP